MVAKALVMYLLHVQISCKILLSVIQRKNNVKANFVYKNDVFNHNPYDAT